MPADWPTRLISPNMTGVEWSHTFHRGISTFRTASFQGLTECLFRQNCRENLPQQVGWRTSGGTPIPSTNTPALGLRRLRFCQEDRRARSPKASACLPKCPRTGILHRNIWIRHLDPTYYSNWVASLRGCRSIRGCYSHVATSRAQVQVNRSTIPHVPG